MFSLVLREGCKDTFFFFFSRLGDLECLADWHAGSCGQCRSCWRRLELTVEKFPVDCLWSNIRRLVLARTFPLFFFLSQWEIESVRSLILTGEAFRREETKAPSGPQARTGPIRSYSERLIRVPFRPAPLGARHGRMFGRLRPSNRSTTVYKFLGLVWINGPSEMSGSMVQKTEANNRYGALEDTTFATLDLPQYLFLRLLAGLSHASVPQLYHLGKICTSSLSLLLSIHPSPCPSTIHFILCFGNRPILASHVGIATAAFALLVARDRE